MVDYHVHSSFSHDSETPAAQQIARAAALGLEELCITEHQEYDPTYAQWTVEPGSFCAFFDALDAPLTVRRGLELGVDEKPDIARMRRDLSLLRPDFTLLSVHTMQGLGPFDPAFFDRAPAASLWPGYIAHLLRCVTAVPPELFCSLAHMDYLAKGSGASHLPGGKWRYALAPAETDALFRYLIEQGKCLEINTSTWPEQGETAGLDWLTRFAELGGEAVTFGSDAHVPARVGHRLADAAELARAAGIRYYATFEAMRPSYHRL